ncbi:MFS transporter [Flindersiella endophytica]
MTTHASGIALFRQPSFALAWTAGLISLAGDWALKIALPILMLQLTGSIAATSGVVIAEMLPALVIGPLAGVFVDRRDRRRVMIVANVLQAAALLPLLAVRDTDSVWIVYVVTVVATAINQFFKPAEAALVPMLVTPDKLLAANSLGAVNNSLARLAGPAAGGLVAAAAGLPGVVAVDATTFLVSAGLLFLVRGQHRVAAPRTDAHPIAAFKEELAGGLRVIRRSRVLLVLVVTFSVTSIGEGIMGTLFAAYVYDALHGGVREVGWLMSAQAVGGVLGGVLGGFVAVRFSAVRLLCVSAIVFGALDIVLFLYPAVWPILWPALLLLVLVGIPAVIMGSAAMSQLQLAATPAFCGRVFAVLGTTQGLAATLGAVLAGAFGERFGVLTILVGQGLGYVLAGVAMGILLRGHAVNVHASNRSVSEVSPSAVSPSPVAAD